MKLKQTELIYCKVNTTRAKLRWNLFRIPKFKKLRNFLYWSCYKVWSIKNSKNNKLEVNASNNKKRILLLRPDHIGDLILSLPAIVNFIQSLDADYTVEILINICNTSIVRALSIFDKAYVFKMIDDKGKKLLPSFDEYLELSQKIGSIDYLIDIKSDGYNLYLLNWMAPNYKSGILLQNTAHPQKISLYNFNFFLDVAKKIGLNMDDDFEEGVRISSLMLQRQFPKKEFQKPIIVFCPEARINKKTWGRIESINLIKALNEKYGKHFIITLVGTKTDIKISLPNVLDFRGKTDIFEAFCIVNSAKLFVGFDSGLTHFSSLTGIKTISIFTAKTDPAIWSAIPSSNNLSILVPQNKKTPCHQMVIDKIDSFI